MTSMPNISAALADFVATTKFEQLPASTVTATKRAVLDAFGVSMAATTLGEGVQAFTDLAISQGTGPCIVFGCDKRTSPVLAALANGALAHALDFEDAHDGALVHPNAATIPAALAAAQAMGTVDGKQLIAAIAIGCDIVCRMGLALRVSLDDFGWYPPPILGAFGATAAAASIYGLTPRQVLDAFSLTLCQATCSAEIKYSPNSVIRAVRDGFAAKTGVLSVELARRNVSGFDAPFEGKAGFFALFARGQYEPQDLVRELGQRFEIDNLSFKPWPTCRGTHVYIEAALKIAKDQGLGVDDIAAIHTTGSRINRMLAEPLERKRAPATAIDAKFSIPFSVATALRHGDVRLDHFRADALADAETLAIASRIDFSVSPTDSGKPIDMTRGTLTLTTRDGRTFSVEGDNPLGHPKRPLSDTALLDKFLLCAKHYARPMAHDTSQRVATHILDLQHPDSLQSLLRLL
ncbi:MAG TPA: MmgE/PrpD family protein [Steroidobacteraceae bacterium]|nr:MmgE/PrpD family protein [Steroidobacteraceae bacterium]